MSLIFPKKEILYAPMLGTLGGGSARGFGRGGARFIAPPGSEFFPSSTAWAVPRGVYEVTAIAVGGGGSGGFSSGNNYGAGGGGSGYYAQQTFETFPNETLTITVGQGGASKTGSGSTSYTSSLNGNFGTASQVSRSGTQLIVANGGQGGRGSANNGGDSVNQPNGCGGNGGNGGGAGDGWGGEGYGGNGGSSGADGGDGTGGNTSFASKGGSGSGATQLSGAGGSGATSYGGAGGGAGGWIGAGVTLTGYTIPVAGNENARNATGGTGWGAGGAGTSGDNGGYTSGAGVAGAIYISWV